MSFSNRLFRCLLLPSLFALYATGAHAESKSITINDQRPVAEAAEQLEKLYGLSVTYEDPPYVHKSEIANFSFTYDLPSRDAYLGGGGSQSTMVASDAIMNMLQSYTVARGQEMFTVTQSNGQFHIVPTHFINALGNAEQLTPVLNTKITILPDSRNSADLVSEICQAVSLATGQNVDEGMIPLSGFMSHTTTITASNEEARSVLSRLLQEFDIPLSWQLFYGPEGRWYVLNIHAVEAVRGVSPHPISVPDVR